MQLKSLKIFGLLLVLMFGVFSYYWQVKHLETTTFQELRAVNELKTQQLTHWLDERRADANVLAQNPIFIELVKSSVDSSTDRERLKNRLALFLGSKSYGQISVHLPDGALIVNAGNQFTHLPSFTHEKFQYALQQVQPTLTDIFVDKNGQRHLDMIMPIWSDAHSYDPIAVLVFHINPRYFIDPLMQHWPSNLPTAQTLLVRFADDQIFAQTPITIDGITQFQGSALDGYESLIRQQKNGLEKGQMACQNPTGRPIFLYCNTLGSPAWSVLSQAEKSALEQPVLWRTLLISFLFGLVLLGIGTWLYQRTKSKQRQMLDGLQVAAMVFDQTNEGIMLTDDNCQIQMVNKAFSNLLGYQSSDVLGKTPNILFSGCHDRDFYTEMWNSINQTGHWQGEIWNRKQNGALIAEWLSISSLTDSKGEVTHYIGVFADISKLKNSEQQLDYLSHHDPLTGLANRRLLNVHLQQALSHHSRQPLSGEHLAILTVDIDRFKNINDSYGQGLGDEVLNRVAETLQTNRRKTDTVARIAGNEFVLVLDELQQPEDAARIATLVIGMLAEPVKLSNGIELSLSVTIGISFLQDPAISADQLLQQADTALYQAKKDGRGGFLFFDHSMTRKAQERLMMESQLKQALVHNQFEVYYQPQVDLQTGAVVSAEALIRWHHPELGMISPAHFIPVCEDIGLIIPVGDLVLRMVLEQGAQWLALGHPRRVLAVNVAALQWQQTDFVEKVTTALDQTGYPPELLELELTESGLMRHEEQAIVAMNRLRQLGVRIALDDFGTGYSSLVYLRNLPLSKLKIDKQFIDEVVGNVKSQQLAKTIITMAHSLGFQVIAEGVEQPAQLAWLVEQGCDSYQGFLCSPPVRADEFILINQCQGCDDL